jgi:hypothetical protein
MPSKKKYSGMRKDYSGRTTYIGPVIVIKEGKVDPSTGKKKAPVKKEA